MKIRRTAYVPLGNNFAVIALIASLLGFGGVAGLSKDFAVILLVIAVILAVIGFISRGRT